MTGYEAAILALLVGGLGPAFYLSCTGDPVNRLIGLELGSAVTTVVLLLLSQVAGLSYELIVPLVLVPLSFAGTLVFTRLLSSGSGGSEG